MNDSTNSFYWPETFSGFHVIAHFFTNDYSIIVSRPVYSYSLGILVGIRGMADDHQTY